MSLTQDQISYLTKLTALADGKNLHIDSILDSFDALTKLDTSSLTHTNKQSLSLRPDVVRRNMDAKSLFTNTKHRVVGNQISLPSIMHGE